MAGAADRAPEEDEHPPSPELLEKIVAHVREEHGRELDMAGDLEWPGHAPKGARVIFYPATPANRASYWCSECPGMKGMLSDPEYGPERQALLARLHPELGVLLRGVPYEERGQIIEDWDRGRLGLRLADDARQRRRQSETRRSDPATQRRRDGCNEFLLQARARLPTDEAAIDELEAALATPEGRREILGAERPVARETIRGYWKRADKARKEAARQQWLELSAAERRHIEARGRRRFPG